MGSPPWHRGVLETASELLLSANQGLREDALPLQQFRGMIQEVLRGDVLAGDENFKGPAPSFTSPISADQGQQRPRSCLQVAAQPAIEGLPPPPAFPRPLGRPFRLEAVGSLAVFDADSDKASYRLPEGTGAGGRHARGPSCRVGQSVSNLRRVIGNVRETRGGSCLFGSPRRPLSELKRRRRLTGTRRGMMMAECRAAGRLPRSREGRSWRTGWD